MPKKIAPTKPGVRHVMGPGSLPLKSFANWYRLESLAQWQNLDMPAVEALAQKIIEIEKAGRRIFVMGNGGSAATASHWATDLSKTSYVKGRKPIQCESLSENMAYVTAIGNDLAFDQIFSRQLQNILRPKDLVILISGSGNSKNLIEAAIYTRKTKAFSCGLLGFNGGKLKTLVDLPILISSDQYGVIEDMHMAIGHIVTFFLKQRPSN